MVGTANRGGNDQGENAGRATGALSSSDAAGMLGCWDFGNDGMIIMVVRINIMEVLQIREAFCREYPGC